MTDHSFSAVRDLFDAALESGEELGAAFTLCIEGEVVLDLIGGHADLARERPFDRRTLTPVFSTTKAVTALMAARLVDQGRIGWTTPVAEVWPEFGQAGKAAVTFEQLLSHQAGLPGFDTPQDPGIWFDPPAVLAKLAGQAPMWPLGQGSGYHPITGGYLIGEVFRRLDGRSLGTALREDLGEPFGLDIWIGLPDSEHGRCAEMKKPPAAADLGQLDDIKRAAFLDRGSAPGGRGSAAWRRLEIPSANGHATARDLARLMSVMACDGMMEGRQVLSPDTARAAMAERVQGQDRVLPFVLSWAAGFMRNQGVWVYGPGEQTVGHSGWGGSCAFADPERRLSGAYVMNRQSVHLIGDPRPVKLIEAAYERL
ncbi:serine hydrolase domain-containing protein [Brevundimonas sp. 2R-24]|uniref:Serine hydrolase domain-containing protein n=1 Tax=Peiella sedimenti TaxID=3061083 RepID=A0ABT8SNQ0_9CAUL|nr:serine hydrolase domain-containing protein [Caulobacteraceae bacterium XZ-24]